MRIPTAPLVALISVAARLASADASPEPPLVAVDHVRVAPADVSDEVGRGEASVREFRLEGNVARLETSFGTVLLGARYERRRLLLPGRFDDETLHELKPSLTLLNDRGPWRLVARIAPGVATDFEHVNGDDVSIDALAQLVYRRDARTRWVAGIAADRTFADTAVYPVVGITHAPSDRLWLGLVFPRPAIRIATAPGTVLYWRSEPIGNRWHVDGEAGERDVDLTVDGVRTGLGIEWRAAGDLHLRLEIGGEFARGVDALDDGGEERAVDPEDTPYVNVSIALMP